MASKDPFPMSSPEAQRLAASVPTTDSALGGAESSSSMDHHQGGTWHSMVTHSEGAGPTRGRADDSASESLMTESRKKIPSTSEYADVEDDNEDDEDEEDEFLDRPLWESRGSTSQRLMARVLRVAERVYRQLYGDQLPPAEMLRMLTLASTLFITIGGYWLLRSLKDPVITSLCGVAVIPKAKMLSVLVVLGVVSIYNRFLDSDIPRHRLFYIFGTFYCGLFCTIALLLMHPTIGLPNEQPSPGRILGWVSYCGIESFGSVMVALFWSFANSNFTLETAKASYGIMVATAQVGSILGPTFVRIFANRIGPARCYLVGGLCMLFLQATMYVYVRVYGANERNATSGGKAPKKETGTFEGLHLFVKYNYIKGIFAITCLFMIEVTIIDFTLKKLASDYFAEEYPCAVGMSCYGAVGGEHGMSKDATSAFSSFMGLFGQATNSLSFVLSLFGTSAVIRYLGLRLTLLLFPSLCLAVIILVRLRPTLYVVFAAMIMLKANSYALNNPTKELLYQPTSSAVRYKAKSWIDIFGDRAAKAAGSIVTNAFSDSTALLVSNGSLVGIAVSTFLIWNAVFMGRKFDEYTSSGYIVGEESTEGPTEEDKNIEMASQQNEAADTSCAIYEDSEVTTLEEGQEESKQGYLDEPAPPQAQVRMV